MGIYTLYEDDVQVQGWKLEGHLNDYYKALEKTQTQLETNGGILFMEEFQETFSAVKKVVEILDQLQIKDSTTKIQVYCNHQIISLTKMLESKTKRYEDAMLYLIQKRLNTILESVHSK